MQSHSINRVAQCPLCDFIGISAALVEQHFHLAHPDTGFVIGNDNESQSPAGGNEEIVFTDSSPQNLLVRF